MEPNPLSDISELREKLSASCLALLSTMSLSACQNSQYQRGVLFLLGGVNDDPARGAVDEAVHCTALGVF